MIKVSRTSFNEKMALLHQASIQLIQDTSIESLMERIAAQACQLGEVKYAALGMLSETGRLERFIPIGLTAEQIANMDHQPVGMGLIGELMCCSESIRVNDIARDPRSIGFPSNHPKMRSMLGVPIRHDNRNLGILLIADKKDGTDFTEEDQRLIEMLASYAAIAITNARLYDRLVKRDQDITHRNENLALLNNMASTLATSTEIDAIIKIALTQLMDFLDLKAGEVYLRPEGEKKLKLVLHRGKTVTNLWKEETFTVGRGMIGMTAKTGLPKVLTVNPNDGSELHESVLENGIHQIASFPLRGRSNVLGVLCVAVLDRRPLTDLDVQFIGAIGSWMGTALENVRYNNNSRRLAVLEERERIGMDLHDGIIQSIYAVGLTLEHARLLLSENPEQSKERIDQSIKGLNNTIRDIRTYILDLRPRQLSDENLMQGLNRLVNEFRANTLAEAHINGPADGLEKLPASKALALFHICQEALANTAKHAKAKKVEVIVWTTGDRVLMEIRDNGKGFEMENTRSSLGHGLSNMQTRARNVGGDLELTSEPGSGTTILTWVPFTSEE
ncbi:MAG: GAF domain-containing sensor histidine kinase [Leptolinea sp.]|nr:GAF domain-containing sensor histidine kinase [Leptolinea sp.]